MVLAKCGRQGGGKLEVFFSCRWDVRIFRNLCRKAVQKGIKFPKLRFNDMTGFGNKSLEVFVSSLQGTCIL